MSKTDRSLLFDRVCFIGIGLIGSSLARAMRVNNLAGRIVCHSNDQTMQRALEIGVVDEIFKDPAQAVLGCDLVVLATPIGTYAAIAPLIGPSLAPGAILTDVGSVKQAVTAVYPYVPSHAHFIPAHPIAGTEHSGPDAGFPELFENRWTILTPEASADKTAIDRIKALWEAVGAQVETMDVLHHDRILAITSHLPHLIAYTIVGTADDLAEETKQEITKYSASGFRDFTRIAASDPTMWRDIFLCNREAVLEIIQRFTEDLTALQRAIRWGDGDTLHRLFARTRKIRRSVIDLGQAYGSGIAKPDVPGDAPP